MDQFLTQVKLRGKDLTVIVGNRVSVSWYYEGDPGQQLGTFDQNAKLLEYS